ncbi:unnamed protein product [Cochlearia groenlandica]
MAEDLPVAEAKLAAMPLPSLDLDELAKRFDDSPPPGDVVDCESALARADAHVTGDAAPLEVTPLAAAPFDQFGSMTASLSVEDAQDLRESVRPEGFEPQVAGLVEDGREIALAEEASVQPGAGTSSSTGEEDQT